MRSVGGDSTIELTYPSAGLHASDVSDDIEITVPEEYSCGREDRC